MCMSREVVLMKKQFAAIFAATAVQGVTCYYGFNNKTNKSIGYNDKLPNYYRVDLNY